MINKDTFNQELERLALMFEKKIPREVAQEIFDRLNPILANDEHLKHLFRRLKEEEHYPRLGRFIALAKELGFVKEHTNGKLPFVIFECECSHSFAVLRKDLAGEFVFKCPKSFYQTCNRAYDAAFLRKLTDGTTHFVKIGKVQQSHK
jgi:hypothetical protein